MHQIPESRRPVDDTAVVVAGLRKSLADKDAALQKASYAAIRLQKQLDGALKQNEILRRQLKLAPQGPRSAALVKAAASQSRVAFRQREEASRKLALAAAERSKRRRFRLAASAVSIAVLILIWGVWSQLPESTTSTSTIAAIPTATPLAARGKVPPALIAVSKPAPSSQVRFEASLNRLNRALLYSPFGSPEQVLHAIRQSGAPGTSPVCDFSWNYGQPALLYHAGIPLDIALDRCASAVEVYAFPQTKAPAESGRGR